MVFHADPPIPEWPGLTGRRVAWARAEDIVTKPLHQVFDWWQAQAKAGLPRRNQFDITQFGAIATHLYIVVAVNGGFELRLAGEEYIRLFALKKGWIWRSDAVDPVTRDSAALLAFVALAKRPLRTIGRLELSERHWVELEALICPLAAGNDGADEFLGCVAALEGSA